MNFRLALLSNHINTGSFYHEYLHSRYSVDAIGFLTLTRTHVQKHHGIISSAGSYAPSPSAVGGGIDRAPDLKKKKIP
jgi:hypothetical protein